MQPISYYEYNMSISKNVLEGRWDSRIITTIQKVTIYSIFPFLLIAAFEAVLKNLVCVTLSNCAITLINTTRKNIFEGVIC